MGVKLWSFYCLAPRTYGLGRSRWMGVPSTRFRDAGDVVGVAARWVGGRSLASGPDIHAVPRGMAVRLRAVAQRVRDLRIVGNNAVEHDDDI